MCECIKYLSKEGYLAPNLLDSKQFFLHALKKDSRLNWRMNKSKPLLLIRYCPSCGEKQETA